MSQAVLRLRPGAANPGLPPSAIQMQVLVQKGPDQGVHFVIKTLPIILGRGDDADLILNDLRCSRHHARLEIQNGKAVLVDLGSSNGLSIGPQRFKSLPILSGMMVALGDSILEFRLPGVAPIKGVALRNPPPGAQLQVSSSKASPPILKKESLQKGINRGGPQPGQLASQTTKPEQSKSRLGLFIIGAFLAIIVFLDDSTHPSSTVSKTIGRKLASITGSKKDEKVDPKDADLSSYLPQTDVSGTLQTLFREGMREYYSGNYKRARSQFETILQVNPQHTLARIYMENCKISLNAIVKKHLENGKKDLDSGKIFKAKGHFEAILRILIKDPFDPSYKEAKEQLNTLNKLLSQRVGL